MAKTNACDAGQGEVEIASQVLAIPQPTAQDKKAIGRGLVTSGTIHLLSGARELIVSLCPTSSFIMKAQAVSHPAATSLLPAAGCIIEMSSTLCLYR